ncbi:ATP-binding cassette domain-containing protein [Paenibacillus sp. SI8]|uniref:ATP-binding cassette domain-containing protein n=1 Tax=unclassified Paenibacillus TaxID=185978 RepID=UPI00346624FA
MPVIEFNQVSHRYKCGGSDGKLALDGVSFTVEEGEFVGVVGANGSGKSTLGQLLNGLLNPSEGYVTVLGLKTADRPSRDQLWMNVGLVFQQPEQQLFEETVFEDVAYGVRNKGIPPEEVEVRVTKALEAVGLVPGEVAGLPPLALSGGQRRRVAIAGVLAMKPSILVLDEPTAGLDGAGRSGILRLIKRLQIESETTIIMISHSMQDVLGLADKLVILEQGRLAAWGDTKQILQEEMLATKPRLLLPERLQILRELKIRGVPVNAHSVTREEVLGELLNLGGIQG